MRPLSSSTYLGVDVLDGPLEPKGVEDDSPARRITVVGPGPSLPWVDAHEAQPRYRRTLRIWCRDAADLADLIAWLDTRGGRALPFWLPSWEADLTLAVPYVRDDVLLETWGAQYARLMFPAGPSRRHIIVHAPSGTRYYRRIISAEEIDPGPGAEAIWISSEIPDDLPAGTVLSFLRYCRQDVDEARIVYAGRVGVCELPIVELPQECPA